MGGQLSIKGPFHTTPLDDARVILGIRCTLPVDHLLVYLLNPIHQGYTVLHNLSKNFW